MAGKDCVFCGIIAREIPSKIVFEDEKVLAFDDIHPQAPVHVVVIPKEHIERVNDLREAHAELMGRLVITAKKIAKDRGIDASGYRIAINCNKDAGQAVFHLHLHLLGGRPMAWPPG